MSPTQEYFHALIRGEGRGVCASLARAGLWWARIPYGIAVWIRNRLFDLKIKKAIRVPAPVVCVGNLTLGGTGKTPCVEYVAKFYRELGLQVAILSRGYGTESGPNDEALVLEENLPDVPHLQDRDRVKCAMTAIEELDSEILILDDGFQHRRLARDLNIVLVDSTRPFWADRLFPRGTLREPMSELRRADVVIITRCKADNWNEAERRLSRMAAGKLILRSSIIPVKLVDGDGHAEELNAFRGRAIAAFCGVGNPESFLKTVREFAHETEPLPSERFREFPDHHNYTRADVENLEKWACSLPQDAVILTTQKDMVKLRLSNLSGRPLRAVVIEFRIAGDESEFHNKLRAIVPEDRETESE